MNPIRFKRATCFLVLTFLVVAISALAAVPLITVNNTLPAASEPIALLQSLFDPGTNAQANAQQGWSVALDGNLAVVSAPAADVDGENSGLVKVYDVTTGALLHTLRNPNPTAEDHFGYSVAISGTRIVVGVPGADFNAASPGVAYVFDLAGAAPAAPVFTLTNPTPVMDDRFGHSVAISGTRAVIGARFDDTGAPDAGSAYVYDLAGNTPEAPVATLISPSPTALAGFGFAVAISVERVVIGEFGARAGMVEAGSAHVYDLAGGAPLVPTVTLTNPTPANYDQFGISVAVSGNRVGVGARYDDTAGNETGSVYVYDLAGAAPMIPVTTLNKPGPAPNDNYGFSVRMDGSRVVVGAPGDGTGAPAAGGAWVYDLSSATPTTPVTTLTNPSPAGGDYAGWSVAISSSRVLVGAVFDDASGPDTGSAYVYDLSSATPTVPVATLNDPTPAARDSFGYVVAVSGSHVAVGAFQDNAGAAAAGSVYVYDRTSVTPTVPVLKLTNPSPESFDWFGFSVAISGTRLVVGTPFDNTGEIDAGTVYVYNLVSGTPRLPVVTLVSPQVAFDGRFGSSVAIAGTRVVVGAPGNNTGAQDAGRAYVYDLAGAIPTMPIVTLTNPSPAIFDSFGNAVAISGSRVVIGAHLDDAGAENAGSAYVYDLTGATPTVPVATLNKPSPEPGDEFGNAVAISGTRVAVAAYQDATGATEAGSVYVYELAGTAPTVPVATLNNPSPAESELFGSAVAISGTRVVVGASQDVMGSADVGSAYVYDLSSVTPTVPVATLANPSPAHLDHFGLSVALDGTSVLVGAPGDDTNAQDRGAVYVFGPVPALSIVPTAPGMAALSWTPAVSSGFVLQYSDDGTPANWLTSPSGGTNPVNIPLTNASRIYRLRHP